MHRDNLQTKIQVAAKTARFDFRLKILVRGRQHAYVDGNRFVIANTCDLTLLQNTQQFDLRRHRHVADLIKKQRPAISVFKFTLPVADRIGESTFNVSKQFAFHQVFSHRSGIDRHKWLLLARAVLMDGLRHDVLARTRFASDQNARVRRSNTFEAFDDRLHAVAGVD